MQTQSKTHYLVRGITAVTVVVLTLWLCSSLWRRSHRHLTPLQVSLWYWQIPCKIDQNESRVLRDLGIKQLFVIAGTLEYAHDKIEVTLPQQWEVAPGAPRVNLVFHVDRSVLKRLETLDPVQVSAQIRQIIASESEAARKAGVQLCGAQIDMDCPTRLLPKYAQILIRLRDAAGPKTLVSATALPTWYSSSEIKVLARAVDFLVPQYYESNLPQKPEDGTAISDVPRLASRVKRAGSIGYPFWAGLPAYGHALLYDDGRRLRGLYHELPVSDALIHPAFQLEKAGRLMADGSIVEAGTSGFPEGTLENGLMFRAIRPDRSGKGLGWRLLYTMPTAELLRKQLDIVRTNRPDNCEGVVIFRYPQPGEVLSLPLAAVASAVRNQPSLLRMNAKLSVKPAVWMAAEAREPLASLPQDVQVKVTNEGDSNPFPLKDSLEVIIDCEQPGVIDLEPGSFDTAETYFVAGGDTAPVRCAPPRANRIRLIRYGIYPGQTLKTGTIRVSGPGVHARWSVMDSSGRRLEGQAAGG